MSNLSEQITELISNIRALQARTHAEVGIVGAAIIEEQLLRALLTKMRPLSGEMKKRLFDGYGPLSSFSAKIDLSYALRIINKDQYDDLTVVRRIRNQFGHSMSLVNFDKLEIREHFKHFKTLQTGETDYRAFYLRKLQEIDRHLDNAIGEADQSSNSESSSEQHPF
jgi:DNA-binding MltR family transcriptional regulator